MFHATLELQATQYTVSGNMKHFNMGSALLFQFNKFSHVRLATSFFLPPVQSINTEPCTITKSRFTRFCFIACYSFYPWFTPSLADSSYL